MKPTYNVGNKTALAEPGLIVLFVPNAKRNQNFTPLRGRTQSHSLWRNLSYSSVLQKAETEVAFAKKGCFSSAFQPLSSSRINPGYHPGIHRLNKTKILQGNGAFQQIIGLKSFPYASSLRRFLKRVDPKTIQGINKVHDCLRLKMFYLSKPRTNLLNWLSRILKSMFRQTSSLCLSYQVKSRFRIFQPQVHRSPRGQKYWLCHRGQDDQSYQEPGCWTPLSSFQERLGSCRVSIYPLSMEKTTSLYCYPQTTTRKGFRPTESLHHRALRLSGVCNQSFPKTPKYLVFLQRPSTHRKGYQRTRRKFCPGQDSNQQLSGKSSLFLFASFCLQHCQLVQETLSTSEISERYFRNYSNRVLGIASQIGQSRKQKCT